MAKQETRAKRNRLKRFFHGQVILYPRCAVMPEPAWLRLTHILKVKEKLRNRLLLLVRVTSLTSVSSRLGAFPHTNTS